MKDFESIKKQSVLTLDLNSDTKPNITNAELTKFVQNVKKLIRKKDIILLVVQKS